MLLYKVHVSMLQSSELKNLIKELLKPSSTSSRLLHIVNASLLLIYPKFAESKQMTIDAILEWNLWPNILTTFGV